MTEKKAAVIRSNHTKLSETHFEDHKVEKIFSLSLSTLEPGQVSNQIIENFRNFVILAGHSRITTILLDEVEPVLVYYVMEKVMFMYPDINWGIVVRVPFTHESPHFIQWLNPQPK